MTELYKNKDWLLWQYEINRLSVYKIAKEINCNYCTVWLWLKKFNIKTRSQSEAISGKLHPLYGKKLSMKARKKMSKAHLGRIKGPQSEEWINKRMESLRRWINKNPDINKGEKHPNWRGGISRLPYSFEFNNELRKQIRERDNFICQKCGIYESELKRKLSIHHIDYDKKNCDPSNLLSLCISCNFKVNYKREYWINYFQKYMKEKFLKYEIN